MEITTNHGPQRAETPAISQNERKTDEAAHSRNSKLPTFLQFLAKKPRPAVIPGADDFQKLRIMDPKFMHFVANNRSMTPGTFQNICTRPDMATIVYIDLDGQVCEAEFKTTRTEALKKSKKAKPESIEDYKFAGASYVDITALRGIPPKPMGKDMQKGSAPAEQRSMREKTYREFVWHLCNIGDQAFEKQQAAERATQTQTDN
jgi:hypothetical protein